MQTITENTTGQIRYSTEQEEQNMYVGYKVKLSRRPRRNTVIGPEDIVNLKIALETSKSWEEFLALI